MEVTPVFYSVFLFRTWASCRVALENDGETTLIWYVMIFYFILFHFISFHFISFLSFCHFQGYSCGIWRFPGQGSNQSYNCRPTPQPQQCQIRGVSVTYTTAQGNAGSLTHEQGYGSNLQPHGSQLDSLTTEPRWELQEICSIFCDNLYGKRIRKRILLVMRILRIYSLNHFPVYHTAVLAIESSRCALY